MLTPLDMRCVRLGETAQRLASREQARPAAQHEAASWPFARHVYIT